MFRKIYDQYQLRFKEVPIIIKAPGRINLIGEHTDYNQGFVLPAAIDKALYFALGKKEGQKELSIYASSYDELLILEATPTQEIPSWGKYFQAILVLLKEEGIVLEGISCVFGGNIPIGAGLSSSAALCCGFLYGLSTLLDLNFSKEKIALMAQQAEIRIGLNCGLMDQYAVLFGKADAIFQLDCQDLSLNYFRLDLEEYQFVLIDSKIEHQLAADSAYNERRTSCENIVRQIAASGYPTIKSLRAISKELLFQFESAVNPLDFKRAKYVLAENERVLQMVEAIQAKKLERMGALLSETHQGLSEAYDVSLPEMDLLIQFATKEASVLGARMMGGGFGGCILTLISKKDQEAALDRIHQQYFEATKASLAVYEINIGNGVSLIDLNSI